MAQGGDATDAKTYYGYLFEANKQPTKVLDALLRGIAIHISENVGKKEEKCLVPEKLAAFYKAVGGNYDSLFVEVPHPSISWIYASIGCQHSLQPTTDDFAPPSIPALTHKGFVRWQSIEILLGPEEHVPFIQNAVKNFGIKNPDTGEAFPVEVPTDAFPLEPDADIEKWHNACAEDLRRKATPSSKEVPRPDLPPRPKVQAAYAHVRPPRSRQNTDDPRIRTDSAYFESTRDPPPPVRPLYTHVSSRPVRPGLSHSPSHRERQFLAPEDTMSPRMSRSRRRSFPENMMNSPSTSPTGAPPIIVQPDLRSRERRHSHPRHARRGSVSSDASSSSDGESPQHKASTNTRTRPRPSTATPLDMPSGVRYTTAPPGAVPMPAAAGPEPRPRMRDRDRDRVDDETKRRSYPIPIDPSGKLSAPFLLGKRDRERAHRSSSRNGNLRWKDLDGAAEEIWRRTSTEEDELPRSSRERADSGREGREGYKRRERDRDQDLRPSLDARHSSHEDGSRRDRDRGDRERERVYVGDSGERRSFRERDKERDRRGQSPVRGVDGRRYPAH